MKIEQRQSPNFNERKAPLDMVVLHYTGMASGAEALARLCDPDAEVSAHYMIWEDGRITQLVSEDKRAWHAGLGSWQGATDINSCSVGVEIVNGGHNVPLSDGSLPPYPACQIDAVISLVQSIVAKHKIPASRIVGHSDIAPGRKDDPGEHFPWKTLAQSGLGIWPRAPRGDLVMGAGLTKGDTGPSVDRLQAALAEIGYGLELNGTYDNATVDVVTAFQRRWQPDRVTGQAGWMTLALISAVADETVKRTPLT